jgi:ABC-type nitrate/sulfonate/bicarbonate transport system substrate-binding protein
VDQSLCKGLAVSFVLSLSSLSSIRSPGRKKLSFRSAASSKTLGYSPLWVAHRQGFFDQQGMDVQLVLTANRVDAALIAVPLSSDEATLEGVKL